MNKKERGKLWLGVSLMGVAGVSLFLAFRPSGAPVSASRPTSGRQAVLQELGKQPETKAPGKSARSVAANPAALDPELRLDLLAKVQDLKYEGTERNIFQFYTPPPAPVKPVAPVVVQPQPTGPPPTPPPPPIPLKFYGFASQPGETPRKAFLADSEDIYIAAEGEVVKRRYKVLKIGVNSVEMQDMQTNHTQRLPLQEQ